MSFTELEAGEGLVLRKVALADVGDIFAEVERSREHLRDWMWWVDETTDPGDILEFVERSLKQDSDGDGCQRTIRFEGRLVGMIGLVNVVQRSRKSEIGYWIGRSFQGRGIVTRSVRALTTHLFSEMGMHRIEIQAGEKNLRSCAVAERLGFVPEGVKSEAEWVNDRFVSVALYRMLRDDWLNS